MSEQPPKFDRYSYLTNTEVKALMKLEGNLIYYINKVFIVLGKELDIINLIHEYAAVL